MSPRRFWCFGKTKDDTGATGSSEGALVAALAEYGALRAEIVTHISAQLTIMTLGFTAMGLLLTLGIDSRGERQTLLWGVPLIAAAASVLYVYRAVDMYRAGRYIQERLWPDVQRLTGLTTSWEQYMKETTRHWSPRVVMTSVALQGVIPLLFLAPAILAILQIKLSFLGATLAVAATTILVVLPHILLAFSNKAR